MSAREAQNLTNVVVAEGAEPLGGEIKLMDAAEAGRVERLGSRCTSGCTEVLIRSDSRRGFAAWKKVERGGVQPPQSRSHNLH